MLQNLKAKDNFGFNVSTPIGGIGFNTDKLAAKDNGGFSVKIPGIGGVGANWADNQVACDSRGNCMLQDRLKAKDNFGFNVSTPIGGIGFNTDKLRAKDNFGFNVSTPIGGIGFNTADNQVACDSRGNCMLQ